MMKQIAAAKMVGLTLALSFSGCSQESSSGLLDSTFVDTVPENSTMLITMSKKLLASGAVRHVNETRNVNKYVMGAHVYGTATQTGSTSLDLVPSLTKGRVDTLYFAKTITKTSGRQSDVTFWSTATSNSGTRKGISLRNDGINILNAATNSSTNLQYNGVNASGLFRQIKIKKAWQRLHGSRWQAQNMTNNDVVNQINQRIDQETPEEIKKSGLNKVIETRKQLANDGGFGERAHFSTTSESLRIAVTKPASSEPLIQPDLGSSDLSVIIHASMFNEMMTKAFAGKEVTQEEMEKQLDLIMASIATPEPQPAPVEGEESEEDHFSILFADNNPMSMEIENGILTIVLRGEKFITSKPYHYQMNISLSYKLNGNSLTLDEESITALPPDFDPATGTMSLKQKVLSKMLVKKFKENMDKEMAPAEVTLSGALAKFGVLKINNVVATNGVLGMTWLGNAPQ